MIEPGLLAPAAEGFLLGAGFILAIGPQNAFVLRQGLIRRHVFAVAAVCFLSDAVLIAAGVAGLGGLVNRQPAALRIVAVAGALFLLGYGLLSLRRAFRKQALRPAQESGAGLGATVATCLLLTFLNPHVYLDTVVLIGGLSGRYMPPASVAYGAGAALASLIWFFGLAYGARLLAPVFARPVAWRILDGAVAAVMGGLAIRLIGESLSV